KTSLLSPVQIPDCPLVSYLWSMKFLSLAFGVFILLLSVYPCCQDACKEERTGEALATSWEAEDLDLEVPCSLFFPCGACGGFTFERGAKTALTSRSDFVRTEI